ncbi:MAG: hypothetical protein LBM16_05525, partial [Clostridiales bacterium]|nr:hypothetical protein [Clostridiales bacterium]
MMDRKPDNNKKPDKINIVSAIIACIVLTVLVNTLLSTYSSSMQTQVEYSAFLSLTEAGAVDVVRFESDRLFFTIKESAARDKVLSILNKDSDGQSLFTDSVFQTGRVFYAGTIYDEQLLPMLKEKNVTFYVRVQNRNAIVDF